MVERSISGPDTIIGSFPGIKLEAREGRSVPFPQMEIDVAWIEDGQLAIGECKTNWRDLSVDEVAKYLELAPLMKCKRVVFSALDNSSVLDPNIQSLINNASVSVELLTNEHLLNQYPGKAIVLEHMPSRHTSPTEAFERNVAYFLDPPENGG